MAMGGGLIITYNFVVRLKYFELYLLHLYFADSFFFFLMSYVLADKTFQIGLREKKIKRLYAYTVYVVSSYKTYLTYIVI